MSEGDKDEATVATSHSAPIPLVDENESVFSVDANQTVYKYRDFSTVNEDDDDPVDAVSPEGGPMTAPSRNSMETSIRVQKFPVKLYAILAQKEFNDIITWMPHGRSWKVLKPNVFESLVMPLFFEYSNYHSFNRLVNAWSFRRVSSGPDRGSYYHELFLRGKPHLQKYMRRLPKTHKKLPMRKQDEPDFYLLDKSTPLPAVEDAPIPGGLSVSNAIHGGNMGGVPQQTGSMGGGMPQPMLGRVMPPTTVSHAPQARFSQGFNEMPEDYNDNGMMSRGALMQSNNGAFRSPMGMPVSSMSNMNMPPTVRMPPNMNGRQMAMYGQQHQQQQAMHQQQQQQQGGMNPQFMNQMPNGNRMPHAMQQQRRFRPHPGMDMPSDGSMMQQQQQQPQGGVYQDNMAPSQGTDEGFYPRPQSQQQPPQQQQQTPMRSRIPPMVDSMQGGVGMYMPEPMPYGDMPPKNDNAYGISNNNNNYRDAMPANDYMYREGMMGGGNGGEYLDMVSPMRRPRN